MDSISFQYPAVYIILCAILGIAYALILYFRHSFIKDPTPGQRRILRALGVVRALVITFIAILLLAPFIKSKFEETQKPVILFLQDNSESVGNTLAQQDSAKYIEQITQLNDKLGDQFDVEPYSFSENYTPGLNFSFNGKLTNLSTNLNDLFSLYANQNVGAVVLATDGIYNTGSNPLYSAKTKFPIYTIALGDTTPQKDLKIDKVYFNRIVYLNDRFKIKVAAVADNIPSASTAIDIYDLTEGSPKKLDSREVEFSPKQSLIEEDFILDAEKSSIRHLQVALHPVSQEYTKANNYKDIFIDVLDSRQKILIIANSPHPDIAAIKQAVESNKNYEVQAKMITEISDVNIEEFSLVVLHQIPSTRYPSRNLIDKIKEKSIPILYILGGQSALGSFNNIQNIIQIQTSGKSFNQATPVINEDFTLFTLSDALARALPEYPPLTVPYGPYKVAPGTKEFLFQQIGSVKTGYPLVVFSEDLQKKAGIICGEGLWRWQLFDFRQHQTHELFDEFISKSIQYLAVKEDKRQFRVRLPKNVFNENEEISFQAELYNDSYELINFPDATIVLIDEEGKEYPYTFSKTEDAYALDAGNFPVGKYSYRAEVTYAGKDLTNTGQFTIMPMQLEAFNTVANHQLLYQLSEESGGKLYYPSNLEALEEALTDNSDLKPVVSTTYKTQSVINVKWLFAIFMGLLAIEWFVRKYEGGY